MDNNYNPEKEYPVGLDVAHRFDMGAMAEYFHHCKCPKFQERSTCALCLGYTGVYMCCDPEMTDEPLDGVSYDQMVARFKQFHVYLLPAILHFTPNHYGWLVERFAIARA